MTWLDHLRSLSWEDIETILNHYEALGPIPGVLAPMIESYLPILPLIAILVANVNAYGLVEGVLLSWVGVVIGAISVFWLSRRFGGRLRSFIERKYPQAQRWIQWVEQHGFTPIFLLACFPFTPSFFVNVASGISRVPFHTFATATLLGKGVMIFLVSFAGQDVHKLFEQPWKLGLIVVFFVLMWFVGRKVETRYMK
ncbi:TVP38/TMEM64 family protein [Paenibacillus silviterrae]|uniref:TVP38/TMEM64 family protein n=1 Tax=Paenibacillus silviterrae TaxID=3242194 RepID=UPI0025430334|nr:TVP38/TMEM64 family protein [Paenibacillus chinjuensis]